MNTTEPITPEPKRESSPARLRRQPGKCQKFPRPRLRRKQKSSSRNATRHSLRLKSGEWAFSPL